MEPNNINYPKLRTECAVFIAIKGFIWLITKLIRCEVIPAYSSADIVDWVVAGELSIIDNNNVFRFMSEYLLIA